MTTGRINQVAVANCRPPFRPTRTDECPLSAGGRTAMSRATFRSVAAVASIQEFVLTEARLCESRFAASAFFQAQLNSVAEAELFRTVSDKYKHYT
jgi:hypothetical protein